MLIVIAAVPLLLGSVGGLTAAAVGLGSTRVVADSAPRPAAMRTLVVDTADLPMAVRIIADPKAREPILVRESFSINGIDGDVSVDFRDVPPRRISAVTADADINIGLPGDGPFAVTSTGSRDGDTVVRVPQTGEIADAQAVISVQSADGDVTIDGVSQSHR